MTAAVTTLAPAARSARSGLVQCGAGGDDVVDDDARAALDARTPACAHPHGAREVLAPTLRAQPRLVDDPPHVREGGNHPQPGRGRGRQLVQRDRRQTLDGSVSAAAHRPP